MTVGTWVCFCFQETTLRILNVLSGISVGRSYLLQDTRLVTVRLVPAPVLTSLAAPAPDGCGLPGIRSRCVPRGLNDTICSTLHTPPPFTYGGVVRPC